MKLSDRLFKHLAQRHLQPELMDDPTLPQDQHDHALKGLTTIHRFSGLVNRFWKPIRAQLLLHQKQHPSGPPLKLMDVGCGDAFLLRQLGIKAANAGLPLALVGVDFSAVALQLASEKANRDGVKIDFAQVDILKETLPEADIVTNSLFLHHFGTPQIVEILNKFKAAAGRMMVVEDLRRTLGGYALCYVASHLLTRSPIVHYDGLRSVEGALTIEEINGLLENASLQNATVSKRWPQRFVIQWHPNQK